MYHIAGITPEAPDLETAFGGNKPRRVFDYNKNERRSAYENLNSSARDSAVNFVMLGCPHVSAEQLVQIAALLDGKRLNGNCALWVHAPRDIRDSAQSRAAADTIRRAGAIVMSDTCPAISRAMPPGTAVVGNRIPPSRRTICPLLPGFKLGSVRSMIVSRPRRAAVGAVNCDDIDGADKSKNHPTGPKGRGRLR